MSTHLQRSPSPADQRDSPRLAGACFTIMASLPIYLFLYLVLHSALKPAKFPVAARASARAHELAAVGAVFLNIEH